MRITYVTYDTELWGGIHVVFQHLELLAEAGHEVFLTTPADKPDWYPLKVPLHRIERLEASLIPSADVIVATFWMTVSPVVESKKGIAVHLCQGYEGDYLEYFHIRDQIDRAYSLKIPKLVISPHLEKLLKERFDAETYYIGQVLNHNIFYPPPSRRKDSPFTILVVGPFEVDFKNIATALRGISYAKRMLSIPIRLIRVSQFPLSKEEKDIIIPDVYYHRIPYSDMGGIYRNSDLFISTSKEAEGFGLPALEAMACGVPTILSKISSYLSFDKIQDYSFFVEPDPESVAMAVKEIIKNKELREHIIKRGLEVSAKFNKEAIQRRLTSAYEEIIQKDRLMKTKRFWNDFHITKSKQRIHWWDSPTIVEHCQRLVTGDPKTDIYAFLKKRFVPDTLRKGLSICGGSGDFERGVIDSGICKSIDIYEIAEERVKEGIRLAKEGGYDITFHIEDVNTARFKEDHYDVFFSWSVLHHIENLEGVFKNVNNALKKGGLLVIQEFIGPNKFQWTDKQIEIVNALLRTLPDRFKKNPETGELITFIERPTIEQMNQTDPSEAIRSQDIIPLLKKFFNIKTIRYFGGSIFNLLFNGIINNFDEDDEKDRALIEIILLIEETLIKEKILENNYAVIIAEKT